jgi:hypothetical protein
MKIIVASASFVLFLWSGTGLAYYVDGNTLVSEMYQWQQVARDPQHTNYGQAARYAGYVLGSYDALSSRHGVCADSQTDAGRIATTVARYLQAHPQRWNEPAFTLVSDALTHAFPCQTK